MRASSSWGTVSVGRAWLLATTLGAATGCSDGATTAGAPPSGSDAVQCALGAALHEHQLVDEPGLRAGLHRPVVGRLETRDDPVHAKDSHTSGTDAIAYRIEKPTELRIGVGPGAVARLRLLDASGREVANASTGGAAARASVAAGDYTLVIEGDGSRESHYVVQPAPCVEGRFGAAAGVQQVMPAERPGVFVQEIASAPESVTQATTTVPAFVGYVGAGSVDQAYVIDDPSDLPAPSDDDGFGPSRLATAVTQFFAGGGGSAIVVGTNGTSSDALIGDPTTRTGLYALDGLGWSMLVLPDLIDLDPAAAADVLGVAVPFAVNAFAFTVVEPPLLLGSEDAAEVASWVQGTLVPALPASALPFAAVYYPQSFVPADAAGLTTGAVGAIAGAYAANDDAQGVWSEPSGTASGALPASLGTPLALNEAEVALLNGAHVNAIVAATVQGVEAPVLNGARTLAAVGSDTTVAPSRTQLMIGASLDEALAWVVFEPNDATLWQSVTTLASSFLQTLWVEGLLYGATASDAFTVTCDATNNTPETIERGVLVVEIQLQLTADTTQPTTLVLTFTTGS